MPRGKFAWASLPDAELLKLRFKDLKIKVEGTWLEKCLHALHEELIERGLRVQPHAWLSNEWFSPENSPGIAIPFYLAHPRLMRLEKKLIFEVEGGTWSDCLRILRHEAGHVVEHSYQLYRRRRFQQLFGPSSRRYPRYYRPNPASRHFVQHLRLWYAQSHPDEDFAETFAVWLKPRSAWRREYEGWPAFAKLEFIDGLAAEIGEARPKVIDRSRIEDVAEETSTLRQHYERKLARYRLPRRSGADELLLKVFTTAPRSSSAPRAASVLREMRNDLRLKLLRSGASSEYLVHQVLRLMISRCEALGLYLRGSRRELKPHLLWVIARLAESYEERQLPRVAL
jgi:hypothetical protein